MNSASAPPLLAIADDLSGGAEVAAAVSLHATRISLLLDTRNARIPAAGEVTVLDLDTRRLDAGAAASAVRTAVGGAGDGILVFKKVDSLLRGNVAAEVGALAADGHGVVVAPALPVADRAVIDGVLHVGGIALHRGTSWRAEPTPPPESIRAALAPLPVTTIPLATVRGPAGRLSAELRAALGAGAVVVCDATTDAELDAVIAACLAFPTTPRLVGSGGLAVALGRALSRAHGAAPPAPPVTPGRGVDTPPLLVVVGTAEPAAAEQVRRLVAGGAASVAADVDTLRAPVPPALPVLSSPVTVVHLHSPRGVDPAAAAGIVAGLARSVAAVGTTADLVLTGGETARRILDELGVGELRPHDQIHHGAVRSRTADGRTVVTRPGSFGGPDSLLHIARALRPDHLERKVPS